MVAEFLKQNRNKNIVLIIMALIIAVFSFPEISLDFDIGIDPPLKWLYNHLFSSDLSLGRDIIFPHGPLAFFMYPLADNFILSVIVTLILQVAFVFQLFHLIDAEKWQEWLLTAVLAWFIFSLSNFNQLILSNISIAYLLFLRNETQLPKFWGIVLTAFAFYVKAYVAIISGTLTFSILAIHLFQHKNYKQTLVDLSVLLGTMLLFWFLMYRQLGGFINYCIGMTHLAGDNSAAAAFHPTNNWWLVVPFLVIVVLIPFLQNNREGKMFGFLFALSFFAAWKYGMAREDYYHVRTYLFFIVISMILFLVYNRRNLMVNIFVILLATVLFAVNMKNVENPQPISISYSGFKNFVQFVSSFQEIKDKSERQNTENMACNRLPEAIRNQIGDKSVDIYPWDYTIVAANRLNWKPRPVIQSYAAYTSWLDKKNAVHFRSNSAPEYFIFGINNITTDPNGFKLESIDNRYLLNDEPQTLIELIRNYERIYCDRNFLVYRKRNQALEIRSVVKKSQSAQWNEWISVPADANQFIRLKLHSDRSFSGKLKSFLFKDELYYMYFKTKDGSTLKYRIVPQNAVDGVWISPFYTSAGDPSPSKIITEVLLTCSDKKRTKNPFTFEWEYFDTGLKVINDFFGKDSVKILEVYVDEKFDLESDNPYWSGFNAQKVINDAVNHQKLYLVEPEAFSPAFKLAVDSLIKLPVSIRVECWLKTDRDAHSSLVIETENAAGEKNWQGIEINRQIVDEDELNQVFNSVDVNLPFRKVTVYIWNNGKKPVFISSINIKMTSESD